LICNNINCQELITSKFLFSFNFHLIFNDAINTKENTCNVIFFQQSANYAIGHILLPAGNGAATKQFFIMIFVRFTLNLHIKFKF